LTSLHHAVIDLERIGDLSENIAQNSISFMDMKDNMSEEGQAELMTISEKASESPRIGLEMSKKLIKQTKPA
jgi:phosphate:Na+ symporter